MSFNNEALDSARRGGGPGMGGGPFDSVQFDSGTGNNHDSQMTAKRGSRQVAQTLDP